MRHFLISLLLAVLAIPMLAQSNMSKPKDFFIAKEIKPPVLRIDRSSVVFKETSGNNAIDANEACRIAFEVTNTGTGEGYSCVARTTATGMSNDIHFADVQLNNIPVGKTIPVEIPITAGMLTKDGQIDFLIQIKEAQGYDSEPLAIAVQTHQFEAPMLQIVDYAISGKDGNSSLTKGDPFNLQVVLQNTKYGKADDVTVRIITHEDVILVNGEPTTHFTSLTPGESKDLTYSMLVLPKYSESTIPIEVRVSEKYGKYAENRTISLNLNQHFSPPIIVNSQERNRNNIDIVRLGSEVDKNIPQTTEVNDMTYVVIIANQEYQNTSNVEYAINDGSVFRNYCENTLGIPSSNIHFVSNATLNNIRYHVRWLGEVLQTHDGQAKAIFYYAGHGIPDERSKDSFLLPIDGVGNDTGTGYKLDDLYATLGSQPSKSTTVFLDACFSGANRNGEMLSSARGVVIRANTAAPSGNMVVFSAAQGDETAIPYNEQSHGMFTFFLLKKLQETAGDVTYEELSDYIQRNVRQRSSVLGKTQTPTTIPSATLGDAWKSWKLK